MKNVVDLTSFSFDTAEAPATRYYALLDTGDLAYVGDFESIAEAFDHDPGNSVWMVSDDDVSQWISTVQAARSGTLPARSTCTSATMPTKRSPS